MAKSTHFIALVALSLMLMLIVNTEIQLAEAQSCGWVHKGWWSSGVDCHSKCKHVWGAFKGRRQWYHDRHACFCYYGSCHH